MRIFQLAILGLCLLVQIWSLDQKYFEKYDKYVVYEVDSTGVDEETFQKIEETISSKLDFWKHPHGGNPFFHIMVSAESRRMFEILLLKQNIAFTVLIEDVGELIRRQHESNDRVQEDPNDFDYGKYHTLDEINNWMITIENKYPKLVTVFNVSHSYQARDIYAMKISIPNASMKPAIWMDGGIHSREWISPATVIYMAYSLLTNYSVDPDVTEILDKFDIYILPVFNVDGYVYTWSKDRMWRKTRSKTRNPLCLGADPNRNWDSHFCESGASKDPCDDTYCGEKPFSESEVRGVAEFLAKHNDTIVSYMNFHSYSQLWMSPYGYTTTKPVDFKTQDTGSIAATQAIAKVYGTQYDHGNIASIIYVASGNSADWTYDTAKILYSYGIELRDQGKYGFLLPPDQIIPSGIETLAGVKSLIQYIGRQLDKKSK